MSVSKDLVDIIKGSDDKGTKAYDTPATVTRVDGSTVWVHIPGGVDETPVKKTINAKAGDTVQVRVSGGSAWLNGNASAPPTDDAQANLAVEYALVAGNAADSAVKSANIASEAAADAKATADSVHGIAVQAQADANEAKTSANSARESAITALTDLGIVEDVIGTLNWVQEHGYYQLSEEQTVVANKVYYSVIATTVSSPTGSPHSNGWYEQDVFYVLTTDTEVNSQKTYYEKSGDIYTAVQSPTGNPSTEGWYEQRVYYVLSQDTSVASGKTYYTVSAVTVSNPIGNPHNNLYYDLVFDTAMSQYVNMHLALTDSGLSLVKDQKSGTVLLSNEGVTIKNANGTIVGKYGSGATIGDINSQHISIVNGQINFWAGTESIQENLVAYVSGQELHIPRVVVVQSLQMGNWRWDATLENHLSLNWIG